jgi:delta-aminolevulinic acid dehydratase/porphobilinogen synthase
MEIEAIRRRIQMRVAMMLALLAFSSSFAGDVYRSYDEAKAVWERNKSTAAYQDYSAAFTQFNNHFHLDEKDGCYALSSGPVNLMLIITHPDNSEFAVITKVLSDVDNAKSRCFQNSYSSVQTKVPPFLPFVLQLTMN